MKDVLVGLAAIAVGALFCWRGYVAMRLIIPIWGAFAGFMLGAGIVAGVEDAGFLRTTASWVVGLLFAVVFGALAYLYFEVSIALAMATVGFALGATVMAALGVEWSWIVVSVGVVVGALLAWLAIVADLPAVLRVPLSQPVFVLGLLFVLVVYFAPGGITAIGGRVRARRARRRQRVAVQVESDQRPGG